MGKTIDVYQYFDLDSISLKDLESQYVDLSPIVSMSGYGGRFIAHKGTIINEEVTSTLSFEETKEQLKSKFHLKDWQITSDIQANNIQLIVLYPSIFRNTKLLKNAMAACGWSFASKGIATRGKMIWKVMSFDPMFQDDVGNEMRKSPLVYHWTPLYCLESIKKEGLKPLSKNAMFSYPNRVHLLKGNISIDESIEIGYNLCKANKDKRNDGRYVLLGIRTKEIPKEMKVFYDPRFEHGFYTKEQIPSNLIHPMFGYDFNINETFKI